MPRGCDYRFRHVARPREVCGLPAVTPAGQMPSLCAWHSRDARPTEFDVRRELECQTSLPDHWLEGAQLAEQDLSRLNLASARLPNADLESARLPSAFLAGACLDGANLRSANLRQANLSYASLAGACLCEAGAEDAHLEHSNLSAADIEGAHLDGAFLQAMKLDYDTNADGVDWGLPGEYRSLQYERAVRVFRALARHFRDVSDHQWDEEFYIREMTALHLASIEAASVPEGSWLQRARCWLAGPVPLSRLPAWIGWGFHRWLWGYGVRPLWVLGWMAWVILLFGFVLFPLLGVTGPGPSPSHRLLDGLLVSIATFTTLGYGSRCPCGVLGEVLGGFEALIGSLLVSVFVVSLATRYVRRG